MTVESEDIRVSYDCDGATTEFDITFKCFISDDIKVVHIDADGVETVLTETTHYSISGNLNTGGKVTTVATYATGVTLLIMLDIELSQETDLPYGSNYKSETLETMSDKLTKICQVLSEKIGRAIKFKVSSDEEDVEFPELTASAVVKVNDAGDGLEMGPTLPALTTENSLILVNAGATGFDEGPTLADLTASKYLRTDPTGAGIIMGETVGTIEAYHAGALAAQVAAELAETNAETAETNAELAETNAETAQTAAELAETNAGLSAAAASASEIAAGLSETATAADALSTAADALSTAADAISTAADRVQTGLDVIAAAASASAASDSEIAAGVSEDNASTSEINAGLSAAAAAASAASINLPTIEEGDAGLLLYVNATVDGYDFSTNTITQVADTIQHALTGFVNRTDSTLSMSGSNFQVTTGSSFVFYSEGVKFTKTTTQSVEITNDNTLHYVSFNNSGVLQVSTDIWVINSNTVLVALVYKTGAAYAIFDERHSYNRNRQWHSWAHYTIGTRYFSGLSGTFTDTTLSITQGVIEDEDLTVDTGGTLTACRLWYRNTGGASMTFESNVTTPFKIVTGAIKYDNAGTLTSVNNNYYVCSYVYATPDIDYPIAVVVGQGQYAGNTAGLNSARAEANPTIPNTINLEWKLIYKVIYHNASGTPDYIEANDKRAVTTGVAGAVTSGSHAALVDRSLPNAHPASAITNTPSGNIVATDVQAAIDELETEKLALSGGTMSGPINYIADAGDSDTYAITLDPPLTAYVTGNVISFKANTANTGACTLNVNGLGAKSIKKMHDTDPANGDIESGQIVTVVYDGTNFQMQSQVAVATAGGIATDTIWAAAGDLLQGTGNDAGEVLTAGIVGQVLQSGGPAAANVWAYPLLRSYLAGLALSNDAGDTAHDIAIAVGECVDSTNTYMMKLAAILTKQVDATWAAGDDAGGMNDGETVGNATWYHVHLLYNPTTGGADAGFDTSVTATNLLADAAVVAAGYTKYRRIGSVLTDGSANIINFVQTGDIVKWLVVAADRAQATLGATTAITLTLSTPVDVVTDAMLQITATGGGGYNYSLSSLDTTDTAAASTNANAAHSSGGLVVTQIRMLTNTSSQIRIRGDNTDGYLRVSTEGYIDRRGRDD